MSIENLKDLNPGLLPAECNLFRRMVEDSRDGISIAQDGKFKYVNKAFCTMLGYSSEELLDISGADLLAPHDKQRVMIRHYQRMDGEMGNFEDFITMIRKDGSYIDLEMSTNSIEYEGKMASYISVRDITERNRMQDALEKSEQKYRDLADLLPQTVYELDMQGKITFMNQAGINAFGKVLQSKDISALDFIAPEDHQRLLANLQSSYQGNKPASGNEYTALRADGSKYPIIVFGAPIHNNGVQTGTRGIIIDISERKAMENALRESESKYKTLIENSQDGIFAIVGDKILFVNNTLCNILGYNPEELYSIPAHELLHPDDQQKGLAISERRKHGDVSTINEIFHFQAKDGTIKETDVFSSVVVLNGQTVSLITVHDITETRRMQEQLQLSEEKYRTVIDNATDGIVITQQGNVVFSNKAMNEMMQCTEEDVIGKSFLNMVVKEDWQTMLDFHKRRMAGEKFTSLYRSKFIRKDGKIITLELNARTSNYNGQPAAFIIMRDISERVKIEDELQTAKQNLEMLNRELEQRIIESSESLTEAHTQLIKLQKENLQSQFDVLKQQVNPHFLFNSLNVLTSLIRLEPELAEKFTEHLSKVYRYVLENKDNELVKLTTELDFLDAYIFLLNIRFMGKIAVNINISEEKKNCLVIPLAMQLLIENAIKHNAMSKKSPLIIDVFIDDNHFLNIINNLQEREAHISTLSWPGFVGYGQK